MQMKPWISKLKIIHCVVKVGLVYFKYMYIDIFSPKFIYKSYIQICKHQSVDTIQNFLDLKICFHEDSHVSDLMIMGGILKNPFFKKKAHTL